MKICFIGPANSAHIIKWCDWFTNHGYEVHVVSFANALINNTAVHYIGNQVNEHGGDFQKIRYLFGARKIKQIVEQINPDIISVHFASSYGTVAALSGLKKYVLSVWGSDIYEFPCKSFFHKTLLRFSLNKACEIFSTSKAMALETQKYTNKHIQVTPFGVDMKLFTPQKRDRKDSSEFVVGTVKTLSPKYGIDYLLQSVAYVKKMRPDIPIRVRIAGKGTHEKEYKSLAENLGISSITDWLGFISQEDAAREWANMDVAIIPSESESFGVSAVEAQASGIPVIISEIPGLMEATSPEISSFIVPRKNAEAIGNILIDLYDNPMKRLQVGCAGREFVIENYEINHCFEKIEKLFIQKKYICNKVS